MILTILTTTYNRKNYLQRLFESLCKQTKFDFQWLVIDDGSTDDTDIWFAQLPKTKFVKEYYKKENGGKHTALNYAHPYIKGELVFIVDSDDWIVENAVEIVSDDWEEFKNDKSICGMTYLRGYDKQTSFLNVKFKKDKEISDNITQILNKNKNREYANLIRISVLKEFPFPEFKGEKYIGESYLFNLAGYKYKTVYFNKIIYITKYLEDGLTKAGHRLRIACPLGGMKICKTRFNSKVSMAVRIKSMWLYICYGKFADLRLKDIVANSGQNAWIMYLNSCFGYALYLYWKKKYGDEII